jgi:hypothetical protein
MPLPSREWEKSAVAPSDPYQRWSGAPKHWVEIPAQRHSPPQVPASVPPPVRVRVPVRVIAPLRRHRRAAAVVLVALVAAAAVAVVAIVGPGTSLARLDAPGTGVEVP